MSKQRGEDQGSGAKRSTKQDPKWMLANDPEFRIGVGLLAFPLFFGFICWHAGRAAVEVLMSGAIMNPSDDSWVKTGLHSAIKSIVEEVLVRISDSVWYITFSFRRTRGPSDWSSRER